jgi:hypothetical protein
MPWFRLDDAFHSHPKIIAAGNEAIGLYVRCGTYAAQHLTDGFIPQRVALLYGSPELAETLVETKLWRRARGGWQMPDYLDYNPSADQVKQERKSAAERQRRRREVVMSRRDSRVTNAVSHTTPTRPDPAQTLTTTGDQSGGGGTSAGMRRRGTRLPDDWMPTRELVEWARQECPHIDSRYETDKFRDYWHAKAGATATKLDWAKTWKNWIRKAAEQRPRGRHSRQAETDELFDDAMARARARSAQENGYDPRGNGTSDQVRQSLLPPAGDR